MTLGWISSDCRITFKTYIGTPASLTAPVHLFLGISFTYKGGFIQLLYTRMFLYSCFGFHLSLLPADTISLCHNNFPMIRRISIYDRLVTKKISSSSIWLNDEIETYFLPIQPLGPIENGLLAPHLSVFPDQSFSRYLSGRKAYGSLKLRSLCVEAHIPTETVV